MKHLNNYKSFLEEVNNNISQNYSKSINNNQNNKGEQKTEIDNKLQKAEDLKKKLTSQQNIELNSLKPDTAKKVADDYKKQVVEFDNTVKDIKNDVKNLDDSLKKTKIVKPIMNKSKTENNL